MLPREAGALRSEASGLTLKHQTRLEMPVGNKDTRLLLSAFVSYEKIKICEYGPRCFRWPTIGPFKNENAEIK